MSEGEEARVDRTGIFIERDLADSIDIEQELDSNVLGPYQFPDPTRRRTAGLVFLVGAVLVMLVVDGGWLPAIGLVGLALWNFASAWPLQVGEEQALAIAGASVDFPVGHASAAVTFAGLRSRPRWNVVVYSAEEPPEQRALVIVDALGGELVGDPYVEDLEAV
jgi:hypothetical protein